MHEAFIDVNNVPTHVMTWGDWIEADLSKQREIVLCIPGNPGLPGYYTRYLAELHYQLGKDIPVWIIGMIVQILFVINIVGSQIVN